MGNCFRIIINKIRKKRIIKKNIVLLMAGLDDSGKTSVLNFISNDLDDNVMTTMGFRVVALKHKFYSIKVYDVGGAPQIRSIWKKYYGDIHGIIYVVDASNLSRLNENKLVFAELISHEHIAGKPILLLANKQDISSAIDELDLVENLDIEHAANSMRCPTRVETCSCIITQEYYKQNTMGIVNGFKWLLDTISKNYVEFNNRIKASQSIIVPISNHVQKRPSISSITPSHASIRSNPFKPIGELVNSSSEKNLLNKNGRVNSRNGFKAKKFLVKNKTAPTLEDDTNNTVNDIEYFHNEIEDRVAFLPLDPINLKSQNFNKTFIPQMRPFTAPATSQRPDVFVMPNLPGQVFQ
ncbi:ADP-ribosylation factor-like protein 13B isoform X1 [Cotesia glomerata]|uniref:ADP-ribosylation factor-like protein 13B isoform X1 n=2 Tax=Cotesia glomerata TaxID=32391 RepID=UPI001D025CD7|nr:ADP-ribosylation factor-like protein 13B isoform X1 [Cotesia glomerata]XP_044593111.1 ADP-ribosylation factor-like protein 13B isoform X1 [Cotesia glomerata]